MIARNILLLLYIITSTASAAAVEVYHQGEGGFPCIRAPATIRVQNGVLLSFAAGRCYTGDNCYPHKDLPGKKNYTAFIVKRSVDGGVPFVVLPIAA